MSELRRGDVVWVDFSGLGAPIRKRRPAVVIQNDIANRFAPHTIVAAIRQDAKKGLPVQISVPAGVAGLTKDSVVDCGFLATVPKAGLASPTRSMPRAIMDQIDEAIRQSLSLS